MSTTPTRAPRGRDAMRTAVRPVGDDGDAGPRVSRGAALAR